MKFAIKQFLVILLTAFASIAVAIAHACIVWPEMMAKTRGLDPEIAKLLQMPMALESCTVVFATAYGLAQTLAKWIGDFRSVALLKARSSAHLRLIHAVGGVIIIACRYFLRAYYGAPVWQSTLMIGFGAFLVIMAILKSPVRRPEPSAQSAA